jgi:hypothetical protein
MKQQTAVEWLVNQVEDFIGLIPVDIIEQAKQMQKEQIIDAVNSQRQLGWDEKGEQYYTEVYGKE